jgi:hypothetical protein
MSIFTVTAANGIWHCLIAVRKIKNCFNLTQKLVMEINKPFTLALFFFTSGLTVLFFLHFQSLYIRMTYTLFSPFPNILDKTQILFHFLLFFTRLANSSHNETPTCWPCLLDFS